MEYSPTLENLAKSVTNNEQFDNLLPQFASQSTLSSIPLSPLLIPTDQLLPYESLDVFDVIKKTLKTV